MAEAAAKQGEPDPSLQGELWCFMKPHKPPWGSQESTENSAGTLDVAGLVLFLLVAAGRHAPVGARAAEGEPEQNCFPP